MSHHPSCPYYPFVCPCAFACHLIQPASTVSCAPQALSPKVPTYMTADAIQSTRLIQQEFERAATSFDQVSEACDRAERRVHFKPSKRALTKSGDGVYESQERRRRSTSSTTIPRSILRPNHFPSTLPTIYIVTFATDSIPNRPANVKQLLDTQLPQRNPPIPHVHTIDARSFTPPIPIFCAQYSGISPLIQDIVLQDRKARHAVKHSVSELLRYGESGMREVSMSVCCHAGTHRSVAIGERIAQGVKAEVGRLGCVEGVKVVVRHVSRIKGKGDPF
jgi:hypothetical protein